MIKVVKDLTNIPSSLIPAFADLFPNRVGQRIIPIPQSSRTTHGKRMIVINATNYTDHPNFNNRYKLTDIKEALCEVYKGKCAFCEQNEELTHVEHYRPKTIYYWLAFSWDNLLMSCPTCNSYKGTKFQLDGVTVTFTNIEANIRSINRSSVIYDASEHPRMVNPEITEPLGQIYFEKDGNILSNNPRFRYTIEECKLNRKALNDRRRSILDRFKEHTRDALISNNSTNDQLIAIKTNLRNFINDSKDEYEEFLAFRRYVIQNGWLNEIIKEKN